MKWLGPAAMAALIIASCAPKENDGLIAESSPVAATAPAAAPSASAPSIEGIPAGDYKLDPGHSSLILRVNHLSFANFTMWFGKVSADLKLDPANPAAAALDVSIDTASLTSANAPKGLWENVLGKEYMDAAGFPAITYKSTAIALTGPNTADVTGDLTIHGVTRPVTLKMTYNGGYAGHIYEPFARIGFSARGSIKRSDFGIAQGIPQPGTTMGVFDDVEIILETEWLGPPWKDAPPGPPPAPH